MVVLLDIDGVMVPAASWKKPEFLMDGFPAFSKNGVDSLRKIISETGASILLTTSHKFNYSLIQWEELFKNRGITNTSIDRLEDNTSYLSRKEEVLNWINKNPGIKQFVIIDDDTSLNGLPATIKEKLILTSPLIGLTDKHIVKAIEILQSTGFTI